MLMNAPRIRGRWSLAAGPEVIGWTTGHVRLHLTGIANAGLDGTPYRQLAGRVERNSLQAVNEGQ